MTECEIRRVDTLIQAIIDLTEQITKLNVELAGPLTEAQIAGKTSAEENNIGQRIYEAQQEMIKKHIQA